MSRPSRIAKRLVLPVLLVAGVLVVAQVVIATPPTANFSFEVLDTTPATGCKTVSFTDTSSDTENDITGISWNFGEGAAQPGTPGETVTHTYATPGTKSVTLTATDASTDPDAEGPLEPDGVETGTMGPVSVAISSPFPTAAITGVSANPVEPDEQFTLTGTVSDDGTATGQWDLDGVAATIEATGLSVQHSFDASGTKTVRFRAVDNCGQIGAFDTDTVFVSNGAPIVTTPVASAAVVRRNQPVSVSVSATDPGGAVTLYEWDLNGDGDYTDPTDQSGAALTQVQTSFASSGNHKINIRVSDNTTPTARQTVVSTDVWVNFPPEADFSVNPSPPLIGDAVTFRLTRSQDTEAGALTHEWDLDGNGTYEFTGTTPPARTYQTAGARSVALRVTDASGEQIVVPKTFTVGSNIRPEASFRFSPRSPLVRQEVEFTSTSDDADDRIAKHEWDFNADGRYDATGRVVTRTFTRPGRKTVSLRVTDSRGAVETTIQQVTVKRKPLKPPPEVIASLGYQRYPWGLRVVALYVDVPRQTTVRIQCKGRGCPSGKFVKRSRKKRATLRFDGFAPSSLRAGAKLTVISSRPDSIAEYFTWKIRGDSQPPLKVKRCKALAARKFKRCG
jgi:large repetitive protein